MQLLMVEQLVVALSHSVLTMSELEKFIDSLKMTQSFSARARIRWTREEQTIAGILIRLQASKSTLNLMLTTLTCSSVKEAQSAVSNLAALVNRVLESNNELALRIADMQVQIEASNAHRASSLLVPLESIDEMSTIGSTEPLIEKSPTLFHRLSNIGGFDQSLQRDLNESQVYARNRRRFSLNTISSSVASSLNYSYLSKCSLAAVSNISVIRLPIYWCDLWNPQYYLLPDSGRDESMKDFFFQDTASTMTGMDSLIDHLLVREAPDYKIALLGTNLGGSSTILMLLYLSWSSDGNRNVENRMILQHIQTTFLNLEELIKEHKIQVDSETRELLQTVKSFRIGSSLASDRALTELCQKLCQDRDIRIAIEWECPTLPTTFRIQRRQKSGVHADEVRFLDLLEDLLCHCTQSNQDVLHMLSCMSGRNRTTFKLNDGRGHFSIEMTSITALPSQPITRILAGLDHIFYVVPLCSYCADLDFIHDMPSRNQMEACLELVSRMTRLDILCHTAITIFFTQTDIFPQRIIDVPIHTRFPRFLGGTNVNAAYQFFVKEFRRRDSRPDAELRLYAPGLDGSTSLNSTVEEIQAGILQNVRSRQQIGDDLEVGLAREC
ncbi:MAG: hypothetical protein Q9191_006772 [Dirinaria sp. TL-2023a]